jgi:hypothetical protein
MPRIKRQFHTPAASALRKKHRKRSPSYKALKGAKNVKWYMR